MANPNILLQGLRPTDPVGAVREGFKTGEYIKNAPVRNKLLDQKTQMNDLAIRQSEQQLDKQTAQFQLEQMVPDAITTLQSLEQGGIEGIQQGMVTLGNRVNAVRERDGDPSDTLELMDKLGAAARGDDFALQSAKNDLHGVIQLGRQAGLVGGQGGAPAGLREFEGMTQGLTPEERERARRIELGLEARAGTVTGQERIATDEQLIGQVARSQGIIEGEKAFSKETKKLQAQYNLKPEVTRAVESAKKSAQLEAQRADQQRSDDKAFKVYNAGMTNLIEALGGTVTGPVLGRLPAFTANQQIADGAKAVMAPVLKSMFRTAGEGTFTDRDQELLMEMVPTRSDEPEAAQAKLKFIDDMVRAKLGQGARGQSGQQEQQPASNSFTSSSGIQFTVE